MSLTCYLAKSVEKYGKVEMNSLHNGLMLCSCMLSNLFGTGNIQSLEELESTNTC